MSNSTLDVLIESEFFRKLLKLFSDLLREYYFLNSLNAFKLQYIEFFVSLIDFKLNNEYMIKEDHEGYYSMLTTLITYSKE